MRADRRTIAAILAIILLVMAVAAFRDLPGYGVSRGTYERRRAIEAVRSRQATNLDAFVNFDFRGFDTLGEEYIFLVAIAGFTLLLAERRGEISDTALEPILGRASVAPDGVVGVFALAFVPACIVFGFYEALHGQLTPGGGFQGGVAIATGALAVWLGGGYRTFVRIFPKAPVEGFETIGALGYVALGVGALFAGGGFLENFLPLGKAGALFSGGTIDALNGFVAMAISGGFIVLFAEFLKETRRPRDASR